MNSTTKTVIIICGPTAVGKTAFAIRLADVYNTAIISADSRQCYKELNIGVAKPSPHELSVVKHYFIDSHNITDAVNAITFEKYALATLEHLFVEKDTVIMVGGTGLYIRAFCEGLDDIPEFSADVRQQITSDYEARGLDWLQQQVQQFDPAFWATSEQQNPRRLMRALEVRLSTGRSITSFRKAEAVQRPFNIIKIGLELAREQLYDRINTRVDQMISEGLLQEAEGLLPFRNLNALQTVGYRELFAYFDGHCSLNTAVENIKTNTRHYAKRQMTWFKNDSSIKWFVAGEQQYQQIIDFVSTHN